MVARIEEFEKERQDLYELIGINERTLGEALEVKAMTNEEIRSKLMQQADLVAEFEEFEFVINDLEETIRQDPRFTELMKLFERSIFLRKKYLENLRQEAMNKAIQHDETPMADPNRDFLSVIDGGSSKQDGISPESKFSDSFTIGQLSKTYDSTTEEQFKKTDKSIADLLMELSPLPTHVEQFINFQGRMRKLDFKVHRNIVYIETVLMANGRTAERVVAQERLALELSKNKLVDMADEDDRLVHALSESFKNRSKEVVAKIREQNRELYEQLKEKDIDIKECSLMLSTALSRLNSLKALRGFIRKKNRLLELKHLEEERDQIRKEKANVDNQIIKNTLLGAQERYSNQSSRRPSQRSIKTKQITPNFASNLLMNVHKKKNSDVSKEGFLTFGSSFKNLREVKQNTKNQSHADFKDNVGTNSVEQLSVGQESQDFKRSSCPVTSKQATRIVFAQPQVALQQIKESQHIFEGNLYDSPVHKPPTVYEKKNTVESIKKNILGSAKQTSRLFEMREELRRKQGQSSEKELPKPHTMLSGSKLKLLGSGAKSRLGSKEKDVRTSYFTLAFGKKIAADAHSKAGESARENMKSRGHLFTTEGSKEGVADPDTARTLVKTKSNRNLSQNAKMKEKLKREMIEVKKRIDSIRMSSSIQHQIEQVPKESARKDGMRLASHLNSPQNSLKNKGTPVKLITQDKTSSASGSGIKMKKPETSKVTRIKPRQFVMVAKLDSEKLEGNGGKLSHRTNRQYIPKSEGNQEIELLFDNGWFQMMVVLSQ